MKRRILQLQDGALKKAEEDVVEKKVSPEESKKQTKIVYEALNIGGRIIVPIAGGALLGVYLDRIFSSSPKLTLSLLLAGVFFGFYAMYTLVRENKED